MISSEHQAKRGILWARQSSKEQSDFSCGDQLATGTAFAKTNGIDIVDEVILDGISGSSGVVADTIDRLIQRKKEKDDFDLIIVHDLSRFSRAGVTASHHYSYLLAEAGIDVLSVHDEHIGGEFGEIFASLKHMTSQQQSKSIALAVTRGSMASLKRGHSPVAVTPPYGIDRLIVGSDGSPRHILHRAGDGTQRMLDPTTRSEIRTFGRDDRGAAFYRRQSDEQSVLVPGNPVHRQVVIEMFEKYDIEGWGYHKVTKWLNDQGIPSALGGRWAKSSVRNILTNPLYIGLGVADRQSFARYYCRSETGPKPVKRALSETAGKKWLSARPRPLDEWVIQRCHELRDFLPMPLRRVVRRRIIRLLREQSEGKRGPKQTPPQREPSEFILTNRIFSRQYGLPMSGRNTGKTSSKLKYYGVTKARNQPNTADDKTIRRLIPAQPLHQLVIGMLGKTLRELPELRERVRREARSKLLNKDGGDATAQLHRRRDELVEQINVLTRTLGNRNLPAVAQQLDAACAQLDDVEAKLKREPKQQEWTAEKLDAAIDAAFAELSTADAFVKKIGRRALDHLLDVLLVKIVVDQETRFTEVEFRLPEWALEAPERLCREVTNVHIGVPEAHPLTGSQSGFLLRRVAVAWLDDQLVGIAA